MRIRASLGFVAVVIAAAALAGQDPPPIAKISPAAAAQRVKDGSAVLVDVRERDELDGGMAEGARWYPMSSIEDDPKAYLKFISSLPADQTIVFYCAAGVRAGSAAEIARKELGRKTANLGGFKDWKNAGLPVKVPAEKLEPGDPPGQGSRPSSMR
jgi:rhodanese-related sulfurtransferase